jgi:hypothetical protein
MTRDNGTYQTPFPEAIRAHWPHPQMPRSSGGALRFRIGARVIKPEFSPTIPSLVQFQSDRIADGEGCYDSDQ